MPIGMVTENNNNADKNRNRNLKQKKRQEEATQQPNSVEDLYDESLNENEYAYNDISHTGGKSKLFILVIAIAAIVIIALLIVVKVRSNATVDETTPEVDSTETDVEQPDSTVDMVDTNSDADLANMTQQANGTYVDNDGAVYDEDGNMIYDEDGNAVDRDAVNPGITDYGEENGSTTAVVYSSSDFLKDLNGLDVSAVYNVVSRDYVYDYVNYTAKRAVIDQGMELYWLDVVYNERNYRVQVPFYYFKDLKTTGICKVQIEVLVLEGGGKIISYMNVVDDSAGVDK